jgi:hypothetical protein
MTGLRIDGNGNVTARPDKTAGTDYTFTVCGPKGENITVSSNRYDGVDNTKNAAQALAPSVSFWAPQFVYRSTYPKNGEILRSQRRNWRRHEIFLNAKSVGWVFIHPADIPAEDVTAAVLDGLERPTN